VFGQKPHKYGFDLFDVVLVGYIHRNIHTAGLGAGIVYYISVGNDTVGYLDNLFVGGIKLCVKKPYLANGTRLTAGVNVITDVKGLVGYDLKSTENIG